LRFAQEFYDLAQSAFSLASSTPATSLNVIFFLLHGEQPRPALAETQRLIAAGLHLADQSRTKNAQAR